MFAQAKPRQVRFKTTTILAGVCVHTRVYMVVIVVVLVFCQALSDLNSTRKVTFSHGPNRLNKSIIH